MINPTGLRRSGITAFVIMALAGPMAVPLEGQAIWTRAPLERGTSIEFNKVLFSEGPDLSTFSLVAYLGTAVPVGRDLLLVGELPYATAKPAGTPFSRQASGNPYLGIEWGQSETLVWEFGVRLPVADNPSFSPAADLGLSSDAADRLEAWTDRAFSIQLAPNLVHRSRDGLVLRLRGGPSLFVPTRGATGEAELILGYAGQVGYEGDLIHVVGGVSGRVVATGFGQTFNHAVARIALDLGGFRPMATLRIPFGDLEGVDAVYGIGLTFGS